MTNTKQIEQLIQGMAYELEKATGFTYTHVRVDICRTNDVGEIRYQSYQDKTGWTDEHRTWEECFQQATSTHFQKKHLLADAAKKEAEAAALRAKAEQL